MNKRKKESLIKEEKLSPRFEYSPEDIQRMLADIDGVVSACKAEQKGINAADMIKTVRGGKVVWITRDQMNKILSKNRKLSGAKYAQRSIRGENSISSEITARVNACKVLLDAIRKAAPQKVAEMMKNLRNLEVVQNRSASLARNVQILEMAIERKKSEDPILRDIDRATSEMVEALEKQDLDQAEKCRQYSDRHSDEYLAKQKRLDPYINKARECRDQFVIEKRKMYQFEFNLIEDGEEILVEQIQELRYHDREGQTTENLHSLANEIQAILREGQPAFDALTDYSVEELEAGSATFAELDKKFLKPLFKKTIEFVDAFRQAWSHFVEGKGAARPPKAGMFEDARKKPSKGMAYQEKAKSSD